jgi:hypothetical protein
MAQVFLWCERGSPTNADRRGPECWAVLKSPMGLGRRVCGVENPETNLDMREARGRFFFQVRPRRWIAVIADSYGGGKGVRNLFRPLLDLRRFHSVSLPACPAGWTGKGY